MDASIINLLTNEMLDFVQEHNSSCIYLENGKAVKGFLSHGDWTNIIVEHSYLVYLDVNMSHDEVRDHLKNLINGD
jgi:hypothetical protein